MINITGVLGTPMRVVMGERNGKPTVRFYDARYTHTPDGQFITEYYAETLLEGSNGLDLQGGVPAWKVDKENMDAVREWLKNE